MSTRSASAQAWDSRGWVNLGERTVNGRFDKDRIEVGRIEGKFSKLTVVVENSDLEMIDFKIEFGDGTNYHPAVQQVFREGTRTRVIELPPGEHTIRYLDFKYKNLPGGGNAKVSVWAWRIGGDVPPPAPPPPPPPSFDSRGWTLLGEREVHGHGRENHDRIEVGRYEGRFSKMTVVVQDADLEMLDMEVKFGRGPSWRPPNVAYYFRENTRTRVIDFPGDERTIRFIDFRYRNVPGEGHAKVQVWAKAEAAPPPPPPPPPSTWRFESRGWEMLGEREVNGHGREDIDRIPVGRAMGKFRKLTVVVLDSELEMIDFSIKFKHGEPFHPAVSYFFREGTRTKVIDLPGDERTIEWIEFKYRNLPGERHAKVQVWAQ
ncbi:MAG: hypothetical protein QM831_35215 [Kofleriaceae bacterium]